MKAYLVIMLPPLLYGVMIGGITTELSFHHNCAEIRWGLKIAVGLGFIAYLWAARKVRDQR